jgi:hypothetical protein
LAILRLSNAGVTTALDQPDSTIISLGGDSR